MNITIVDDLDPEVLAMLQAFYSRSHMPIQQRLEDLSADKQDNIKNKLNEFYVGYGHASIADCGFTTVFIEGVSILAAKAIQDNSLYNGQETSTRYIPFTKQNLVSPGLDSLEIQEKWIDLYERVQKLSYNSLLKLNEEFIKEGKTTEKAIKARSFDIARGFLPCGVKTQLSWTTSLRKAQENCIRLMSHPLEEVRFIGTNIFCQLSKKYPSSFLDVDNEKQYKRLQEEINWQSKILHYEPYFDTSVKDLDEFFVRSSVGYLECSKNKLTMIESEFFEVFKERKKGQSIPKYIDNLIDVSLDVVLDFGSFRDLQRHRTLNIHMPMVDFRFGFNEWYFNILDRLCPIDSQTIEEEVQELVYSVKDLLLTNKLRNEDAQYYLPLMTNVDCHIGLSFSSLVYLLELRSTETVHPTLREVVLQIAEEYKTMFPEIPIFIDDSSIENISKKRGDQDIIKKG